jgi:hypothetical protein
LLPEDRRAFDESPRVVEDQAGLSARRRQCQHVSGFARGESADVVDARDETSASPDVETYRAVLLALATSGGMLVGIGSPYRRAGLLYSKFRDHFGQHDPDVLVVKASSLMLNPTLDATIIERARKADPVAAESEWDSEFRRDIETYVSRDVIDAAVSRGVFERAPLAGFSYRAFVDPSRGSVDSFCLAIGHDEDGRAVIDARSAWAR